MTLSAINPEVIAVLEKLGFEDNGNGATNETDGLLEQTFEHFAGARWISVYISMETRVGSTIVNIDLLDNGRVEDYSSHYAHTDEQIEHLANVLKETLAKL